MHRDRALSTRVAVHFRAARWQSGPAQLERRRVRQLRAEVIQRFLILRHAARSAAVADRLGDLRIEATLDRERIMRVPLVRLRPLPRGDENDGLGETRRQGAVEAHSRGFFLSQQGRLHVSNARAATHYGVNPQGLTHARSATMNQVGGDRRHQMSARRVRVSAHR